MRPLTRRQLLGAITCGCGGLAFSPRWPLASANDGAAVVAEPEVLVTTAIGDVTTPRFYRQDIGTAPGRMHEPTAGTDGNIWTSPLDGSLWQYDTRTGQTTVHNLKQLTGRDWKGLHLWPIAWRSKVYLCCPTLPELTVWDRDQQRVTTHPFPQSQPAVYGGFVVPAWQHLYFYDTHHASVLKWDPATETGVHFPCPYSLSGTLYMSMALPERHEIWGSTYTGNDLVCFDIRTDQWTGHHTCPDKKATPTAGGLLVDDTLFVSDHLQGRLFPFNVKTGAWGAPIPVPGFRDWFGYVSGGWPFRGQLYFCHSTWTGGNNSLDGQPHHFLGSWTVFDPQTERFSRLDLPTREGEERDLLMSDYCATFEDQLYLLAVNQQSPNNVIVLRTKPLG
jgi:hypothetical protein